MIICARCGWAIHQDFGWVNTYGELECADGRAHKPAPAKVVTNSLQKSA